MSTPQPDRELMELLDRIAAQEDSALKRLYERTSSPLFGLALRIVRNRDVAEAKKVPLVPFLMDGFADRPELFLADGIHPAAEAQPRIVDTVWAGLHPLLVSDGRKSARR